MNEKELDEQIERILVTINQHGYGDEGMNNLQKQLHSLIDMKLKIIASRKERRWTDWLWDNSKPLIGGFFTLFTTILVIGNEHNGPILSKAFGFISKPKI